MSFLLAQHKCFLLKNWAVWKVIWNWCFPNDTVRFLGGKLKIEKGRLLKSTGGRAEKLAAVALNQDWSSPRVRLSPELRNSLDIPHRTSVAAATTCRQLGVHEHCDLPTHLVTLPDDLRPYYDPWHIRWLISIVITTAHCSFIWCSSATLLFNVKGHVCASLDIQRL